MGAGDTGSKTTGYTFIFEGEAMSHTPGPWSIAYGYMVVGPDSKGVAQCNTTGAHPVAQEEMRENAKLIAAAPRLLATLKELLSYSSSYGFSSGAIEMKIILDQVQEAIAEAEGKP